MTDTRQAAGAAPPRAWVWIRWLLPVAGLVTLTGYFGPWIDHPVAGLVILGLDLGEYVKFLPAIRGGQVILWREGFYLPLAATALAGSLLAFRDELRYSWPVRALLLAAAIAAALNMLPPAWTPQRMMTPEFQQQSAAIGLALASIAFSPFLALLPRRVTAIALALLCLLAAAVPVWQFLQVLPDINVLYNRPQLPGRGLYLCVAGLLLLGGVALWFGWARPAPKTSQ